MDETTWDLLRAAVAAAPYPVDVLPADPARSAACLAGLEVTTRSVLGAVVAHSGGLLIDHGWLRVLGGGHPGLPDVATARVSGLVAADVLGGQFCWRPARPGAEPTVQYFAPDSLAWEDLELGYGRWLHVMLAGGATSFYAALRWPGWAAEVAPIGLDQGISLMPPPWTAEGKDLSAVSRRPVPMAELVALHGAKADRLG